MADQLTRNQRRKRITEISEQAKLLRWIATKAQDVNPTTYRGVEPVPGKDAFIAYYTSDQGLRMFCAPLIQCQPDKIGLVFLANGRPARAEDVNAILSIREAV
ncbi:MAG: hypothetical protein V3U96_04195 [Paracoccaceae bacterium]